MNLLFYVIITLQTCEKEVISIATVKEIKDVDIYQKPTLTQEKHLKRSLELKFTDRFKVNYVVDKVDNENLPYEPNYKFLLKNGFVEMVPNSKLTHSYKNQNEKTTDKLNKAIDMLNPNKYKDLAQQQQETQQEQQQQTQQQEQINNSTIEEK